MIALLRKAVDEQRRSAVAWGIGLLGLAFLLAVAFALSKNRRGVSWRTVGVALALQAAFAPDGITVLQTNRPAGWQTAQLRRWEQHQSLGLSQAQTTQRLTQSASVPADKLATLWHYYQTRQLHAGIDPALLRLQQDSLGRDSSAASQAYAALDKLRYPLTAADQAPTPAELRRQTCPARTSLNHSSPPRSRRHSGKARSLITISGAADICTS